MENEIVESSDLLDDNGNLIQKGWARKLLLNYNRENIIAGKYRIKEWDYYEITNPDYCLILLISDIGYAGFTYVYWVDFNKDYGKRTFKVSFFTKGSLNLPRTADEGDACFPKKKSTKKKYKMYFQRSPDSRILSFNFPDFKGKQFKGKGISGEINLYQDPKMDTMVNVIPFKDKKKFVYVQKVNCMPANGTVKLGDQSFEFSEKDTFSCLDWSRGVFPYHTSWYWGSASGIVNGKPLGFNIDYGFGDESLASKNMIFYNGKGHKLDRVKFHFEKKDLMKPWNFTSNDGRFEMQRDSVFDNAGEANLLLLQIWAHKIYGFFTGDLILDNGEKIHIDKSDRLFGFAEHCKWRW